MDPKATQLHSLGDDARLKSYAPQFFCVKSGYRIGNRESIDGSRKHTPVPIPRLERRIPRS